MPIVVLKCDYNNLMECVIYFSKMKEVNNVFMWISRNDKIRYYYCIIL